MCANESPRCFDQAQDISGQRVRPDGERIVFDESVDRFAESPAAITMRGRQQERRIALGKSQLSLRRHKFRRTLTILGGYYMTAEATETSQSAETSENAGHAAVPPSFPALLNRPAVKLPLPKDFDATEEATHLLTLWEQNLRLRVYDFEEFIHAGGSGIVFRVKEQQSGSVWALKIARKKAFRLATSRRGGTPSQSPFSDTEVSALAKVSHPNVVSLRDRISGRNGIIAIITTYVEAPSPLDEYLRDVLSKDPDPRGTRGIKSFSPIRLERACAFLVERCREMALALAHMHEKNLYHCDIKPANILIGSSRHAVLTDLGSCIGFNSIEEMQSKERLRIRFTWTYAHPELQDLAKDVRSISGGGLKVSVNVEPASGLERFDLFAFGRTMQEALATLVDEFGERCFASFGFRFLHLIACLLLDGRNAPVRDRVSKRDGRRFVSDVALDYPAGLFKKHRITTASELLEKLERFNRDYSWNGKIPELDAWRPDCINTGAGGVAPFTPRVAAILKHPSVRRLRNELQLGWVKEVYPGATHSRWSHTLGVMGNLADYYNALLADPELPTARILLGQSDIEHSLVAAILHDIGQTAFGHDLEAVNLALFNHEQFIPRLLDEKRLAPETLKAAIGKHWPNVSIDRVLLILGILSASRGRSGEVGPVDLPVDGLARDAINGPIDSDKLDYLIRDGASCGVNYSCGIDRSRFLRSLTAHARKSGPTGTRLALAYRAKGAAAVEGVLLARYELYSSVYWHHTFRCIQAMFVQAATNAFGSLSLARNPTAFRSAQSAFYDGVICGLPMDARKVGKRKGARAPDVSDIPPLSVRKEPSLEFVWHFADGRHRALIERLADRDLYKRVYEVRTSELLPQLDYSGLKERLGAENRVSIAARLEEAFINSIHKKIADRHGPIESIAESQAREIAQGLERSNLPLVVVDYPVKGIPDETNIPPEIGDASRKYISGRTPEPTFGREVFHKVRQMQIECATVRVFAEPLLHELIIRYLDPEEVRACAFDAMPFLDIRR